MNIFALYVVLFAFGFMYLNSQVIILRRKNRISLGDGNNEDLIRARSLYYNFLEFSAVFLILMFTCAMFRVNTYLLHVFGFVFCVMRVVHVFAIRKGIVKYRVLAIASSHTIIGLMAFIVLFKLIF